MAKKKMALAPDPLPDPTISPLSVPVFFPYFPFGVSLIKETPWSEDIVVVEAKGPPWAIVLRNWTIHNDSSYGHLLNLQLVAEFPLLLKSFKASEFAAFMDNVEITITLEDGTGTEQEVLVPSISIIEVR